MSQTTVADALVEYLSSRGVVNIFGVLAHTSFAIGDAIARRPHMKFVNAQHEGGAGNMALGYARATKKPAVCLVSAGTDRAISDTRSFSAAETTHPFASTAPLLTSKL